MKLGTLLARTEFRQLQTQIGEQRAEIERLRKNGVAQAYSLGQEIDLLQARIGELDRHATQLDQELAARCGELDGAQVKETQLHACIAELEQQLALVGSDLQQARQREQEQGAQIELLGQQSRQQAEALEARIKEASDEGELLLLQLHQVQEELEALFLGEQETKVQLQAKQDELTAKQAQLETSEQQRVEAVKACDEQARLAEERKQELARLGAQLEGQVHEAQQENELLLLQLHQVQEELEHYFLEHQKLQRDNEALAQRWQRLEQRYPDYLDYDRIEALAVDAVSDTPRVDWRVLNATVGGLTHPELLFSTVLKDGKPGIEMRTDDSGNETTVLVPRELTLPQASAAIARFRAIGTGQWKRLLAAAAAIEQFLGNRSPAQGLPEDFDPVFWRQALLPLVTDLRALPGVFRFDRVQLKRELINSDYEHLWLVFHGASYGKKYAWPKLELRIGAAQVQQGNFSRHPKIELPRIDGKTAPFQSWFEESFDDYGGKFELRFDLVRHRFDVGVWSKLDADDQGMLLSLIAVLPLALGQMQADKVAITRPWECWIRLSSDTLEVLRKRLLQARTPAPQAA